MTDAHAAVSRKRGVNPIWAVPIVALALGIWMVIYTIQSQGPEIAIVFSTAEGIEAGKTKVKLRDVDVGMVDKVALGDDLESVVITVSLDKTAESLLREDTQFWVVRPRIGKAGVSGLGTLLSGGYIQLEPGEGAAGRREYVGLEEPPVTPAATPGLRIVLTAEHAGSVSAGDPVLFRGYTVGRVETEEFDMETKQMSYGVFIDAPYDGLLTDAHRFWDASGISVSAGADGIQADSVALETLLIGGVEVGRPVGIGLGDPVESGAVFELYQSYAAVNQRPHRYSVEYVVRFERSVRGLQPGAPVEYRGLQVGEVVRVMLTEMTTYRRGQGQPIAVLLSLSPARIELPDTPAGVERFQEGITTGVGHGLRATLSTGSLLTGALFVEIDFFPTAEPETIGSFAGRPTIPTVASGLAGIEQQLMAFLEKLNELPLEGLVAEGENTLADLDRLIAGEGVQRLPESIDATLRELKDVLASLSDESELQARLLPMITELDRTLASLRGVLKTLEEQPNALIFNRAYRDDPRPPAGSQ